MTINILTKDFQSVNGPKLIKEENMIIARIAGGLGNQMFQYALGKHLAIKNKTILKLDLTHLLNSNRNKFQPRNFQLSYFNINTKIASNKEILKHTLPKIRNRYIYYLLKKIYSKNGMIIEKNSFFDQKILNTQNNSYICGHWICEKYFLDIQKIIRKEFTLKDTLHKKLMKRWGNILKQNNVSIHIRRGDYLKLKHIYHTLEADYYIKALNIIKSRTDFSNIIIFSDDISWCRDNLKLETCIFVEEQSAYEDLYLMSLCNHNIISNSTFSWWGAWLNKYKNKIIIAPEKWFRKHNHCFDIIPQNWLKI